MTHTDKGEVPILPWSCTALSQEIEQDRRIAVLGKGTSFEPLTMTPAALKFFSRFGLKEQGVFDTADIPELQESEAEQSKRYISEIEAGINTIQLY